MESKAGRVNNKPHLCFARVLLRCQRNWPRGCIHRDESCGNGFATSYWRNTDFQVCAPSGVLFRWHLV